MGEHWEDVADHLGSAYLRYSFTKGTRQEIDHLVDALHLSAGMRVLDVGCGPGRHTRELASRGIACHGIDISATFIDLARRDAPTLASFERADARTLRLTEAFDAVICLCQGAFGVMTDDGDDATVLRAMAAALVPGGRLALSAFNAFHVVLYHEQGSFDVATGICHERSTIKDPAGRDAEIDLWTGCYTPRELRLLCAQSGLLVDRISSVEPGRYGDDPPSTDAPELLLLATRV